MAIDGKQEPIDPGTIRTAYLAPGRHVVAAGAENVRAHRVALALAAADR